MTDTRTVGQELQGQFVDTIRKNQEAAVDAVRAWAEAVQAVVPALPAAPQLADKLPTAEELVNNAYDLAEQLLAGQREFALNVLQAAAPVLGRKEAAAQ